MLMSLIVRSFMPGERLNLGPLDRRSISRVLRLRVWFQYKLDRYSHPRFNNLPMEGAYTREHLVPYKDKERNRSKLNRKVLKLQSGIIIKILMVCNWLRNVKNERSKLQTFRSKIFDLHQ